jgi:hypothetical protein
MTIAETFRRLEPILASRVCLWVRQMRNAISPDEARADGREYVKTLSTPSANAIRDAPVQTAFKARVQAKNEFVIRSCFWLNTIFSPTRDRV